MDILPIIQSLPPEIQQALAKDGFEAVKALLGCIYKSCGELLLPWQKERIANAEAKALKIKSEAVASSIRTIGEAASEYPKLAINYTGDLEDLNINNADTQYLEARANIRIKHQNLRKQKNLESIVGKAYNELIDKKLETKEEVDDDLLTRFFNMAEDISDEDMQNLWSRILAGEILKPRTYSLRLLDFLYNTSKEELDRILKISPFVALDGFIIQNENMLQNMGISFEDILFYSEIGILHSNIQIERTYTIKALEKKHMIFYNNEYVCIGNNKSNTIQQFQFSIYSVTRLGMELFKLANTPTNKDFFVENIKQWGDNYPNIELSFYRINYLKNNNIEYDNHPIIEINKE